MIFQNMKTLKIFLASSSELSHERKEVEVFINRQNNKLVKKGLFLELTIWEDFLDAMSKSRLQDEYNRAVQDSDIFISLFFTKVGKYTKEEFETAYKSFKDNNKPKYIYTYFKDAQIYISQIDEKIFSLLKFKDELNELGHFYTSYTSAEDLLRQLKTQLDKIIEHETAPDTKDTHNDLESLIRKKFNPMTPTGIDTFVAKIINQPQVRGFDISEFMKRNYEEKIAYLMLFFAGEQEFLKTAIKNY